jgi:formylglycine-generating enzyme required for sulfatase activity
MEEGVNKETKKGSAWKIWIAVIAILLVGGFLTLRLIRTPKPSTEVAPPSVQEGKRPSTLPKKKFRLVEKPDWVSPTAGMQFVWVPMLDMWVGKYEVANDEYRKKNASHDSRDHKGHRLNADRQPAVYVNFDDAKSYGDWLTQKDLTTGKLPAGYRYRLPSEDEWQTFAQCGDDRAFPWGNEWPPLTGQAGNYDDEAVFDSARVDGYEDGFVVACEVEKSWKNPWGLYGVGGNVWELVSGDSTGVSFGSWCGASWFVSSPVTQRCDYRLGGEGSERHSDYGFRLVLAPAASK